MSRILPCDPARPAVDIIEAAVEVLDNGGVVVMPTETQYSLSIRADRPEAMATIGRLKGRESSVKPALFVRDLSLAEQFCLLNTAARALGERYLPGPMTLVVPARPGQRVVADGFVSEHGIGVRISSSPVVAAVMNRVPFAVTATSANRSGEMTPSTAAEIARLFGDEVDLYLDGGPCRGVVPSTVVKVDGGVTILRHGQIAEAEIRRFIEKERRDGRL